MTHILKAATLTIILLAHTSNAATKLDLESCAKFTVEVKNITDGDTLVGNIDLGFSISLKDAKIRLYGINTPESRTRNLQEKELGLAAKARLSELLGSARKVQICVDQNNPRGKFGRILAIMLADSVNVNEILISEGHARHYFGGKREPWFPTR